LIEFADIVASCRRQAQGVDKESPAAVAVGIQEKDFNAARKDTSDARFNEPTDGNARPRRL
jgi:hypothetical protein